MSHHDHPPQDGTHSEQHQPDAAAASTHHQDHEALFPPTVDAAEEASGDMLGKAATIAVVGVGVALISAELIPGMIIGVAAAFLPGVGPKMRPFFKSTVRAGYTAFRKTREMLAEANEQIQDVMAEAKSEQSHPVSPATPPQPPPRA